jgi:hypothetical protein
MLNRLFEGKVRFTAGFSFYIGPMPLPGAWLQSYSSLSQAGVPVTKSQQKKLYPSIQLFYPDIHAATILLSDSHGLRFNNFIPGNQLQRTPRLFLHRAEPVQSGAMPVYIH